MMFETIPTAYPWSWNFQTMQSNLFMVQILPNFVKINFSLSNKSKPNELLPMMRACCNVFQRLKKMFKSSSVGCITLFTLGSSHSLLRAMLREIQKKRKRGIKFCRSRKKYLCDACVESGSWWGLKCKTCGRSASLSQPQRSAQKVS